MIMNHMIAILRVSYAALQENVLEEATRMIPDTRQRLEGALQDLSNFMVSSRSPQHDAQHNPPTKHPIFSCCTPVVFTWHGTAPECWSSERASVAKGTQGVCLTHRVGDKASENMLCRWA